MLCFEILSYLLWSEILNYTCKIKLSSIRCQNHFYFVKFSKKIRGYIIHTGFSPCWGFGERLIILEIKSETFSEAWEKSWTWLSITVRDDGSMNCNVGNDCSHIMQLVTLVMIATTVHKLTCADWLIHDHVTWVGKMTIWVCLCSSSVWYYSPWHVLLHYMFLLCFALRCLPTVCSYYCVS